MNNKTAKKIRKTVHKVARVDMGRMLEALIKDKLIFRLYYAYVIVFKKDTSKIKFRMGE